MKTDGLYHIHLSVADMARSLRFYTQAFGMTELFREGDEMIFLQSPGTNDVITLNSSREKAGDGGGIAHFGFKLAEGETLDRAVADVEAAGGKLIRRGEHAPGHPFAYVSDPDGYVIELYGSTDTATDPKATPPAPSSNT